MPSHGLGWGGQRADPSPRGSAPMVVKRPPVISSRAPHSSPPIGPDGSASALDRARIPSRLEAEQRRMLVYQLLNAGADKGQIRQACKDKFDMREDLVDNLISLVKKERSNQFDADRPKYKSEQVARLQADLVRMRAQSTKPWGAIARHEQLLARVVGTIEPVNVNIQGVLNIRESLVAVVQHLDLESIDDIVQEQLELTARGNAARLIAPTSTRTIDEDDKGN